MGVTMGVTTRPATAADHTAIYDIVAAAFGQADEADLVDRLRADGDVLVERVAETEAGELIGHILFSRLATDNGLRFAALAPVSVEPVRQLGGIGGQLINDGLDACRVIGLDAVVVLGHPGYYPRFGFRAEAAQVISAPFSGKAFMALALGRDALAAPVTVTYAKGFGL
jgi:putative acetyltransferase